MEVNVVLRTSIQARKPVSGVAAFGIAASWFFLTMASTPLEAQLRNEGTHEHGVGSLNVAIDGGVISVELLGPMASFVGFEHAPSDDEEANRLAEVLEVLGRPEGFLGFNVEAGCVAGEMEVHSPEVHRADTHDDHEHGHDQGEHDEDGHMEIEARYEFRCQNGDRLIALDVQLFDYFPFMEKVEAQILGVAGVVVQELTPGAERLTLKD